VRSPQHRKTARPQDRPAPHAPERQPAPPSGPGFDESSVLFLQQHAGNAAVAGLLRRPQPPAARSARAFVARQPEGAGGATAAPPAARPYVIEPNEPDLFLFAGTATAEDVALTLFGDARLTANFLFVRTPSRTMVEGVVPRAVRPRPVEALQPEPLKAMRGALDDALKTDVDRTISILSERSIGGGDESALAEMCLRWSQRSEIEKAGGTSYFDAYLGALHAQRLSQPHWYTLTFSETTHTALEWLLEETEEKSEQVKKAIELRSSKFKGTTGYTPTDKSPQLAPGDVAGRFYWGSGDAEGSSMQVRIRAHVGRAPDEESAARLVQRLIVGEATTSGLGMGVVIPGAQGGFDGYIVGFPIFDPLVLDPIADERGHWYWYHPRTRFLSTHEMWDAATRAQFRSDVREQSGDIRSDLVQMEALATETRVAVPPEVLPPDLLKAWMRADRAMIVVSGAIARQENPPGGEITAAIRDFLDRARGFVKRFDKWETLDPNDERSGAILANPYFEEHRHEIIVERLQAADSPRAWRSVLGDYHSVVKNMDKYLAEQLRARGGKENAEAAQRLEFVGETARRLDAHMLDHPDGRRIRATFYPLDSLTAEAGGLAQAHAQPITCLFYVWREDDEWNLLDLTTPKRVKVTSEEGGSETSPPLGLFTELNTKLRFPHGRLYWEMPDGTIRVMDTTEPWSLTDWLTWIGIGLVVLGATVASAGLATPATVLIVGGSLTSAAAGVADIVEKKQAGVLETRDVVVNVLQVIGSLATAGAAVSGRVIASSAFSTATRARFATGLDKYVYRQLVGTSLLMDGITFVLATDEALRQYTEARARGGDDLSLVRLAAHMIANGTIVLLGARGDMADIMRGRNLYLDVDFGSQAIARPLQSQRELTNALRGMKGVANPDELARLLTRADIDPELSMRIRAEITQGIADGLLDGPSLQRVLSRMRGGANLHQVLENLAELRHANRVAASGGVAEGSRMHIGVVAGEPVKLSDGRTVKIDPVDEADVIWLGSDGVVHLDEVKNTANALTGKLTKNPDYFKKMLEWRDAGAADGPRRVSVTIESETGWTDVFGRTAAMRKLIDAGLPLQIAGRTWSPEKMRQIWAATEAKARALGMWPPGKDFFDKMATLDDTEKFLGISLR
jgi:hypothetical protein